MNKPTLADLQAFMEVDVRLRYKPSFRDLVEMMSELI